MLDFKFNWDESINTGLEVIDTQHKELFRIGRAVEQLVITHCIGVDEKHLLQIICELREFAAYHFYEEEHLMDLYDISEKEEHKKEHQTYRNMITNIDCKLLGENTYAEIIKLKDSITQLIFSHMLAIDLRMAEELRQKMNDK